MFLYDSGAEKKKANYILLAHSREVDKIGNKLNWVIFF